MNRLFLTAASLVVVATSALAQQITTGSYGNGWFHSYTTTGPTGFGAGFTQGFLSSRAAGGLGGDGVAIGSYLPGVITGADRQLQFEIQVSLHGGGARAFDPTRSERYSGTYAAAEGNFFDVPASVSLSGNHGSRISCEIQIHKGHVPTGKGECVDRKNAHYWLQF